MLLFGCQTRQGQNKSTVDDSVKIDSIQQLRKDSIVQAEVKEKENMRLDSLADIAKSKPIWGERTSIVGDFDGNGTQDTLYEKYISQLTGKETNKSYDFGALGDGPDYIFYWQQWIAEKKILLKLVSKKPGINPFLVNKNGLDHGFLYLENVGDLNQDSTDEIAFILNSIDFSNGNTCFLATYKNEKWKLIASFSIMEFDFQYDPATQKKPRPKYVFKKPDGKIYLKEFDGDKLGNTNWKRLKTNW